MMSKTNVNCIKDRLVVLCDVELGVHSSET